MTFGSAQHVGEQGFYWWLGVVDSVDDDPKNNKLGMARVRIFNLHDTVKDRTQLPWAQVMMPVTSPGVNGVGDTPCLMVGSAVFGFFADAAQGVKLARAPIIIGTIPNFPDENGHSIPLDARGKRSFKRTSQSVEPKDPYKAEYSKNRVIKTQAGHMIELDDTNGAERVHIRHKSGSYIEMGPDGYVTIKSAKDSFDITGGVKNVHIKGDCNVQVEGNLAATAKGLATISGQSDIEIVAAGWLKLMGALGIKLSSGGSIAVESPAGLTLTEGSLHVVDGIASGTGISGTWSAGGSSITTVDGIVVSIKKTGI